MKLFALFVLFVLAGSLSMGCSDATSTTSYPLQLITVSDTIVANAAAFNFKVIKNGVPLKGAKLWQTDLPSGIPFYMGTSFISDSNGNFPHFVVVVTKDTMTAVAYQAVSGDSLTSNYVRFSPQ
jgi:hypothetical protein